MKVSYNWLKTYFNDEIPKPEQLADLYALHSFEVEGIEQKGDDSILDIKVLPDRAHYALSHRGIASELSFITDHPKDRSHAEPIPATIDDKVEIMIDDPFYCRRYLARIVDISDSPMERGKCAKRESMLQAIGQRTINPIVDSTNFVMYDIGQPLHAFDADKIKGSIIIRAAQEGEKITLLDGRTIDLTLDDRVIADGDGPLVIAGVKGGKRAEVTSETKRLLIESANFEPTSVRKTSTRLDIRSDSSKRFENEITPDLAMHGMNDICALIKEIYPGAKFGPLAEQYPEKAMEQTIAFDPSYVEERLGIKIPLEMIEDILRRMNIHIKKGGMGDRTWHLVVPLIRLDLSSPEDIVEEVGRIYGYDKISGKLPPRSDKDPDILDSHLVSELLRDALVDAGFSEVKLYSLVARGEIETAYPLAKDKSFVRDNIRDGIIESVKRNAMNADLLGLDAIQVFEIGRVFRHSGEEAWLALGALQVKKAKGKKSYDLIEQAISRLKDAGIAVESKIQTDERSQVAYLECSLNDIVNKIQKDSLKYDAIKSPQALGRAYKKISAFPFIVRDIAVFVPVSVGADAVWDAISSAIDGAGAKDLLARHSIFDTFKKGDKVSFAFRMVFQSMEKTMTDEEANGIMEKIYSEMRAKGWEVR